MTTPLEQACPCRSALAERLRFVAAHPQEAHRRTAHSSPGRSATAPPRQRVHSRAFLRSGILKSIRELEARIDAAAPTPAPEHDDPTGCGGAGPAH
jgi:hypothetical protein